MTSLKAKYIKLSETAFDMEAFIYKNDSMKENHIK